MITIRRVPREEMLEAHRRASEDQPPAPAPINTVPALQLVDPGSLEPLVYRGREYPVRPVSYMDGLALQRASIEIRRLQDDPPRTLEALDRIEQFSQDLLALFHSLLDPIPAENPFLDATPWEVGELLGFFSKCLTRRPARSRAMGSGLRH